MANKMTGISVSLPLEISSTDGPYRLNKNIGQVIKQNFKNLVLTSPGERIMIPEFGCGLRRFLFEGINGSTYDSIVTTINEQVQEYMPFISLDIIKLLNQNDIPTMRANEIRITIEYSVPGINLGDTLEITEEFTT
jgi:phage baseplate assembly protein W